MLAEVRVMNAMSKPSEKKSGIENIDSNKARKPNETRIRFLAEGYRTNRTTPRTKDATIARSVSKP